MKKKVTENVEEFNLSRMVFNIYMRCNNLSEYSEGLNELSNKCHKQLSYLRDLRNIYVNEYASREEIILYNEHKRMIKNGYSDCSIFDHLFKLSTDECNEYLFSTIKIIPLKLKNLVSSYKKTNCSNYDCVEAIYERYVAYYEKKSKLNSDKEFSNQFDNACCEIEKLIDLGFYSLTDYAKFFSSSDVSSTKILSRLSGARNFICRHNRDLWDYYEFCMRENKRNTFLILKDKIDECNERIRLHVSGAWKFDIIDFYLLMGMSLSQFKDICSGNVSCYDLAAFNIFSSDYLDNGSLFINDSSILNGKYSVNSRIITDDEKALIINFLYQYNIPFNYFNVALVKFINGGLDSYINSKVKKKDSKLGF